jgi:hypothetical protein
LPVAAGDATLTGMLVGPLVLGGFGDVLMVVVAAAVLAGMLGVYRAL